MIDPMLSPFARPYMFETSFARTSLDDFPSLEEAMREADLPAEQPEAQEEARIPSPDEEPRRPGCAQVAPGAWSRPDLGLIHRVRSRATFAELSRVRPRRDGPVWIRRLEIPGQAQPQVAYAIGRRTGNAVIRNRLRRQLRSIVRAHEGELSAGTSYLVGVTASGEAASFEELSAAYSRCLGAHRG